MIKIDNIQIEDGRRQTIFLLETPTKSRWVLQIQAVFNLSENCTKGFTSGLGTVQKTTRKD